MQLENPMTRGRTTRTAAFTVALTLAFFAFAAPAAADEGPHPEFEEQQAAMEELGALEGEDFEMAYVNSIIAHHMAALEMAGSVVDRAPHEEVRADAAKIVEDQQAEIDLLTTYLADTYQQEAAPDERKLMSEEMMAMLRDAAPDMAEVMFLLMMREHHEMAIMMGEMALEKGVSDTLAEQAQTMIDSQTEEQERFAGYLQEWYGIEAPEPTGDAMAAMELAQSEMPNTAMSGPKSVPTGRGVLPILAGIALLSAAVIVAAGRGRRLARAAVAVRR